MKEAAKIVSMIVATHGTLPLLRRLVSVRCNQLQI